MRVLPYGRDAVLLEFDSLDAVLGADVALAALKHPGVVEVVPALRTLLVTFVPAADRTAAIEVARLSLPMAAGEGPLVEVPVWYDGVDLADVATLTGLTIAGVIKLHAETTFIGACAGFAPGFCYLTGLPDELRVPRLATPRPRVPAGSVAIADVLSGVYPTASPGGWRLLGHTDAVLWDSKRTPPALISPGTRVRFVPT